MVNKNKKTILAVKNVSKIYKMNGFDVKALDGVSLSIKEGEFVAIIGPSGSGKSTLMHLIGCLDIPTKGEVILDGHKVARMSEGSLADIRNQKIGFVFQAFNLLSKTTALENVSLPLLYGGITEEKASEMAQTALKQVDLEDRVGHYSNQLSGGQQQRVAVARALVSNPAIILADEPTGNLDSKSGVDVMSVFKKLHKEGRTVILVTHDSSVAKQAQRIIKLKDGHIQK